MVIGKNEQTAHLHIAILCEPALEQVITDVFSCTQIMKNLEIPNTDTTLGYIIIPEPPTHTSTQLAVDIFVQKTYESQKKTYCGAPLILKCQHNITKHHSTSQATFGGIVKASFATGETRFYGMTAGHVIRATQQHLHQLSGPSEHVSSSPFDVIAWLSNDDLIGQPIDPDEVPGVTARRTVPSHDWSLFELSSPRPNRATYAQKRMGASTIDQHADEEDSHAIRGREANFPR